MQFVTTTAMGGVVFLVPVVLLVLVLAKAAGFMMVVAEPMAGWLPIDSIGGVAIANLIALLSVFVVCFLAGLVARHALAGAFVRQLEAKVLVNVPGYAMLKSLFSKFDEDSAEGLKPVAVRLGQAERIGLEITRMDDGRSVVFLPGTPSAFSGITQVFPSDQVAYLDVPVGKVVEVSENFGHGVSELLASGTRR